MHTQNTAEISESADYLGTATYSPDDNKLRLYPFHRLSTDDYARVRAAGFRWAPKQELFVAPMWTPGRADLLLELCGEIGDEDTSLLDRAEERSERFGDYSDKRLADYKAESGRVRAIADGIPFGQPILVGHHSERHARKDAARIENGMRRAIKAFDTSRYWTDRAAGAIRHAKYKELPGVRARRIKGIQADLRKSERNTKEARALLALWTKLPEGGVSCKDGQQMTFRDRALFVAGRDHLSRKFSLAEFPRDLPASQYEGNMSYWSALDNDIITPEYARSQFMASKERIIAREARWIEHYSNRLAYETAMLDEAGASDLLKPKPRPAQLPLCNYRAESITVPNMYRRNDLITYPQVEMTKAEYAAINRDYKGTRIVENSHRIRTAMRGHTLVCVFLTDSKEVPKPEPVSISPPEPSYSVREHVHVPIRTTPDAEAVDSLRDSLKAGVQAVAAPQLFPTPAAIAERMAELADIEPGSRILEPSAGTGVILKALAGYGAMQTAGTVQAVEINSGLADQLCGMFPDIDVHTGDFLAASFGTFDRILMNPPFKDGADIQHIQHALTMLAPGGIIVAICANGPRQQAKLQPLADSWEPLPAGTFAGTNVSAALITIRSEETA